MLLIKLALNSLGISWVPLNPDYRPAEAAYVLQDSEVQLTITTAALAVQMQAAITASTLNTPKALIETFDSLPIANSDTPSRAAITPDTEAWCLLGLSQLTRSHRRGMARVVPYGRYSASRRR